jgi:hypothetical protein
MTNTAFTCGAEYVRTPTDVQDLSLGIQRDAIHRYVQSHGISIVASYEVACAQCQFHRGLLAAFWRREIGNHVQSARCRTRLDKRGK